MRQVDRETALAWLNEGGGVPGLPQTVTDLERTSHHRCMLYVYEYHATDTQTQTPPTAPSEIGLAKHKTALGLP